MKGLSLEQINAILAKEKGRKPRNSSTKSGIDTNDRRYGTWFKLAHKMLDDETNELLKCENPNCSDPRDHSEYSQICAYVEGHYMCRFCFLEGWLLSNPEQQTLTSTP